MANERHLLVEIAGTYATGTGDIGEIWAVTLRHALVFGTVDNLGTLPNNWDVVDADVARTEADWTIAGNWSVLAGSAVFNADDWLNDQVAPAMVAWFTDSFIGSRALMNTIKVFPIVTPLGRSIPPPAQTQGSPMLLTFTGTPPSGGAGTQVMPAQNSLVQSHTTAQTGRKGRGRMYPPMMPVAKTLNDGTVDGSVTLAYSSWQATMLAATVYSDISPAGAHTKPIITGKPFIKYGVIDTVSVGNIVDTQQRRRNRLNEVRQSTVVSY